MSVSIITPVWPLFLISCFIWVAPTMNSSQALISAGLRAWVARSDFSRSAMYYSCWPPVWYADTKPAVSTLISLILGEDLALRFCNPGARSYWPPPGLLNELPTALLAIIRFLSPPSCDCTGGNRESVSQRVCQLKPPYMLLSAIPWFCMYTEFAFNRL